jgi:1,4-alpha-glucan branching enzyme
VDWWLLGAGPYHQGVQQFVQDLNKLYAAEPALWQSDYDHSGFYWIDASDHDNSVMSFLRQDTTFRNQVAVVLNLTPVTRYRYRVGLPRAGKWREVLNSDAQLYGGSNVGNLGGVVAVPHKCHNQQFSAELTLPPLSIVAFKSEEAAS